MRRGGGEETETREGGGEEVRRGIWRSREEVKGPNPLTLLNNERADN